MTPYMLSLKFINAKVFSQKEISKRVDTFYMFGRLTQKEYGELVSLILEVYEGKKGPIAPKEPEPDETIPTPTPEENIGTGIPPKQDGELPKEDIVETEVPLEENPEETVPETETHLETESTEPTDSNPVDAEPTA